MDDGLSCRLMEEERSSEIGAEEGSGRCCGESGKLQNCVATGVDEWKEERAMGRIIEEEMAYGRKEYCVVLIRLGMTLRSRLSRRAGGEKISESWQEEDCRRGEE